MRWAVVEGSIILDRKNDDDEKQVYTPDRKRPFSSKRKKESVCVPRRRSLPPSPPPNTTSFLSSSSAAEARERGANRLLLIPMICQRAGCITPQQGPYYHACIHCGAQTDRRRSSHDV